MARRQWAGYAEVRHDRRAAQLLRNTTTGALRVLAVPAKFVHPSGNTFVRLEGVSGATAVGTGILGPRVSAAKTARWPGTPRPATSGSSTSPTGFAQAEAHAISGTTAVGQAWTADGAARATRCHGTRRRARCASSRVPAGVRLAATPLAVSGDYDRRNQLLGRRSRPSNRLGPAHRRCTRPRPAPGDRRTASRVPWTARLRSAVAAPARRARRGRSLGIRARDRCAELTLPARSKTATADGVSGTVVVGSTPARHRWCGTSQLASVAVLPAAGRLRRVSRDARCERTHDRRLLPVSHRCRRRRIRGA